MTKEKKGKIGKLLNAIDQFVWRRKGLIVRLWFYTEPCEGGDFFGEKVYVKRRYFKNI